MKCQCGCGEELTANQAASQMFYQAITHKISVNDETMKKFSGLSSEEKTIGFFTALFDMTDQCVKLAVEENDEVSMLLAGTLQKILLVFSMSFNDKNYEQINKFIKFMKSVVDLKDLMDETTGNVFSFPVPNKEVSH